MDSNQALSSLVLGTLLTFPCTESGQDKILAQSVRPVQSTVRRVAATRRVDDEFPEGTEVGGDLGGETSSLEGEGNGKVCSFLRIPNLHLLQVIDPRYEDGGTWLLWLREVKSRDGLHTYVNCILEPFLHLKQRC